MRLSAISKGQTIQVLRYRTRNRISASGPSSPSRSLEYRLGERWALTGEYDEFDEYNGGVKWRVYSREGRPKADAKP